jgi:5-methylthioadenosine/S-adenosylhomocysteine deaminase
VRSSNVSTLCFESSRWVLKYALLVITILQGGTIVPCSAPGERSKGSSKGSPETFADDTFVGDLVLEGERIHAIHPGGGAVNAYRTAGTAMRIIDATGCAVFPGFIQAHVHLCQVLMRGMADDLPLLEWLKQRIWPLEAAHDEASLRASSELGLLEMALAGTTTILDMGTVNDHGAVMDAAWRSQLTVFSGKAMMDAGADVPKRLRESTKRSLEQSDALLRDYHKKGNRLHYAYAPRFILSCTEKLFRAVAQRSHENGAIMHSHAAEHPGERDYVRQIFNGRDDVDVLESWGFCGERAVLAHGVQLTDKQARRCAEIGTRFVHCPSANLKLGSGIARVGELTMVQWALGADGAPCNNNLDPWTELRHASLLAKSRTSTTALPARAALRLATIEGARALGIAHETGSLDVGKLADIVVARIDDVHAVPGGDAYSKLVYACKASDVVHVFARGNPIVRFGESTVFDSERVRRTAVNQATRLASRAQISRSV